MKPSTKYKASNATILTIALLLDLAMWAGAIWAVAKLLTVL